MTIDTEYFFRRLQRGHDLKVELRISCTRLPIRLRGRVGEQVEVTVWGPDQERFLALSQDNLDDFLEANGYFG